ISCDLMIVEVRDVVRFFLSSSRRHTIFSRDWSSDVCSSDLDAATRLADPAIARRGMMIAVHADDLAAARELVARWAELAPGDTELPRFRAMLALRAGESEEAYAHFLRMTAAPNPELVAANLQAVTGMLAGEENIWR